MASDDGTPSPVPPKEHEPSPRRQRRSPDGDKEGEDEGEYRKRPRHGGHHDSHKDEKEAADGGVASIPPPPPLPLPVAGLLTADDDEREEGEILEEGEIPEYDEERFGDTVRAEFVNSEPGEVKEDTANGRINNLAPVSLDGVRPPPEGHSEATAISSDTDITIGKQRLIDGAGEMLHESHGVNGSMNYDDYAPPEKYVKENSSGNEAEEIDKKLAFKDAGKDRSKDDDHSFKRKTRDDREGIVSDHDSKRQKSRKQSDSLHGHVTSDSRKRSVSPDSLRDRYKLREASPSYRKHYGESLLNERSRNGSSRETRHEKDSSSRTNSNSLDRGRNGSDREDSEYSKGDINDDRNHTDGAEKEKHARKEREHSRSRHDGREERHSQDRHTMQGSRDSDRYMDKDRSSRDRDRERDQVRSRDTNRERVKNDDRDTDRNKDGGRDRDRDRSEGRHAERGKSRDRDSHNGSRRSKYGDDREHDRDRDRGHRDWERIEGRHVERGKSRDRDGHNGSRRYKYDDDRDSDRNRDRGGHREHARSEGRHTERGKSKDRDGSRRSKYDEFEYHADRPRERKLGAHFKHKNEEADAKITREEEEDYEEKVEQQLAEQDDDDPEKILEESRRRRLAILEKYKQQQAQQQQQQSDTLSDHQKKENGSIAEDAKENTEFDSAYADGNLNVNAVATPVSDQLFSVGKSPQENGKVFENAAPGGLGCGTPTGERSGDMFCDDIFGESPTGVRKTDKGENVPVERSGLHDNWDDAEGYYSYRLGEVLDGRYEIIAAHGKGVFSTVVRAKDLKAGKGDPEEVAVKIIRNNDTMYKAGMDELVILNKLVGADPENRRHCVRFLSSFKYRNHLCLVFESLHMNVREVLKKFGRNIGLKLTAVRTYAKQLFIALKHLKNCGVLHCDIKPDNMLVNEAKNVLKLCDFGNAMFAGKNEITPYLVSRFYRAPEIILGLAYDHPMDMWSVGCCLFELYSGKVLFPGPSNNDMLRLHMELKGPFPKKMLKKGLFTERHFDQDFNFHSAEEDPVTKKTLKRLLVNIKPKDIGTIFTIYQEEDSKMLGHFKDLLEKIFVLDPDKRLTVSQALSHPFISSK